MQRAGWIERHFALVGPVRAWRRARAITKQVWADHREEEIEVDRHVCTIWVWCIVAIAISYAVILVAF